MAEKQQQREKSGPRVKVPSFAECAERYMESHRAGWKNDKHIAQWESTLRTYAYPVLGMMAVDKVTVEQVLKVLKPIWTEKPETASRPRGRIEMVLGWATAMKHRSGDNPAAWKGALSHLLPAIGKVQTIAHRKAVPYAAGGAGADEAQRQQRQGFDLHHPHRRPHRGGHRRHLGRDRPQPEALDRSGRAYEGRQDVSCFTRS
jgi:hypothetical protein